MQRNDAYWVLIALLAAASAFNLIPLNPLVFALPSVLIPFIFALLAAPSVSGRPGADPSRAFLGAIFGLVIVFMVLMLYLQQILSLTPLDVAAAFVIAALALVSVERNDSLEAASAEAFAVALLLARTDILVGDTFGQYIFAVLFFFVAAYAFSRPAAGGLESVLLTARGALSVALALIFSLGFLALPAYGPSMASVFLSASHLMKSD